MDLDQKSTHTMSDKCCINLLNLHHKINIYTIELIIVETTHLKQITTETRIFIFISRLQ